MLLVMALEWEPCPKYSINFSIVSKICLDVLLWWKFLNTPSLRPHLYVLKLGMRGLVGMDQYVQEDNEGVIRV